MHSLLRHLLLCTLLAATCGAHAQTSPPAPATEEQQVLAADDAYVAAEVARDEAAMRRLVDDRFVFNKDDGTTSGKDAFLKHALALPQTGQTVRERSVLIEGNFAFVFATTDIKLAFPGKPEFVYSGRYTCVYVKRDGRWLMLALQIQDRK